ncbi:hypothetical protein [Methanosarcina sp.]|uniref:hypothetical protein n=1 Tax=Methanosarcina sp. TaxID=2213 RepID=UPI002989271B|nr:hypothetical protein [Methanosarcina sp.]MDW5549706.1 hypothetical protein [Methanosarcina sp.]MDW5552893.1 hypothetical protein [Methanosarcina sp.]MDW5558093.1 hypothetical protein [Methanosarcina sp.]
MTTREHLETVYSCCVSATNTEASKTHGENNYSTMSTVTVPNILGRIQIQLIKLTV